MLLIPGFLAPLLFGVHIAIFFRLVKIEERALNRNVAIRLDSQLRKHLARRTKWRLVLSKSWRKLMKTFVIFAACLSFSIAQVAQADVALPTKPATQGPAHPPGVHTPAVNLEANGGAGRSNPNIRRSALMLGQPINRAPLAMNAQVPPRNFQPRQRPEQSPPGQYVGLINGTSQTTNNSRENSNRQNNNRKNDNRRSFFDALRRCQHEPHDRNWWKQHCRTIVFVNTAYYYLDAGYWYPAYGYDPSYNYYDYDGPIYTYGNLLPDQVIANVQEALQQLGYYVGPVTGSLGPGTRAALANYQRDYGLIITGAIDEPTVASLGLN